VAFIRADLTQPNGSPAANAPLGTLLRAAFHDAGTYNPATNTGGANGSFRNERGDPNHAGLRGAFDALDRYYAQINALLPAGTSISYADIVQLAGAVAVEVTGGPSTIVDSVSVGRVDASGADSTTQLLGRNAGVTRQECTVANGGYTLEEMIALIGAHTIGFTRTGNPPNVVTTPLSATPVAFGICDHISANIHGGERRWRPSQLVTGFSKECHLLY